LLLRRFVPVVLAAGLLVSGCGSSKKEAGVTAATTTTTLAGVAGPGGDFCAKVRAYSDRFAVTVRSLVAGGGTGAQARAELRQRLQEVRALTPDLERTAPAEIRDDLRVARGSLDNLYAALERVDFDLLKVDSSALTIRTDPKFGASAANIGRYVREKCGVSAGGTATTAATSGSGTGSTLPGDEGVSNP